MVKKYGRKRSRRGRGRRGYKRRRMSKRGRGSLAKRAFVMAKRLTNAVEETKYFSYQVISDVASGLVSGGTQWWELTNQANYSALFTDPAGTHTSGAPIVGNKFYDRYIKGKWEIHMDNVNNEEETVNFTVAVVSFKADADASYVGGGPTNVFANHVARASGQAYFDPRYIKVHYYKHFTRTMGGTAPGTAGESTRYGHFKITRNKMIRVNRTPVTLAPNAAVSIQDGLFFVVITDNSSVDLENPRLNAHFLRCIKDNDTYNI